jgi:hypothetical protein
MFALQGATTTDTSSISVRRAVYWEGTKSDSAYQWFPTWMELKIRDYFVGAGYEVLNEEKLPDFLQEQIKQSSTSVVVFADNVVPVSVIKNNSRDCLLRKYLDAGGKVVFLGENPLTVVRDSATGVFKKLDYTIPEKILGIHYPARNIDSGFYESSPTEEGKRWGLNNNWIGFGAIDPSEATTVLAKNEFGMATAWVKSYCDKIGTGVLQLWLPAIGREIIYSIRMAAEFGVMW